MKNQIKIILINQIPEEDRISKYINSSCIAGGKEQTCLELMDVIDDCGFDFTKPLSVSVNTNRKCESLRLHICQQRKYVADDLYELGGEA